jgi:uncharacterized membrane protein
LAVQLQQQLQQQHFHATTAPYTTVSTTMTRLEAVAAVTAAAVVVVIDSLTPALLPRIRMRSAFHQTFLEAFGLLDTIIITIIS